MLTKASSFRVGLFLLIGIVVGLTAVIWLGASRMFEETKAYVTYFDESVSGLSTDASVKYRGVTVGRRGWDQCGSGRQTDRGIHAD